MRRISRTIYDDGKYIIKEWDDENYYWVLGLDEHGRWQGYTKSLLSLVRIIKRIGLLK